MKTLLPRWIFCLAFLLMGALFLIARPPLMTTEPEISLIPADQVPAIGTFYSLQNLDQPPLPFCPFSNIQVYSVQGGGFVFDDSQIDYVAIREQAVFEAAVKRELTAMAAEEQTSLASGGMMTMSSSPLPPGGGEGGGTNTVEESWSSPPVTNGLRLARPILSANAVSLTVLGGTNTDLYDLYSTTNLTGSHITNSTWTWQARVVDGQTYYLPRGSSPQMFYILGLTNDTDHGGLSDAWEKLVTHGNINNPADDGMPLVGIRVVDSVAIEQQSTNTAKFLLTRTGTNTSFPLTVSCLRSGTASNSIDYTLSPSSTNPYPMDCTVEFPAGQTNLEITLTAINDGVTEGTETATLTLANNWIGYRVDTNHASATAYILEEYTHTYTSNVDFSLGVMSGLEAVSNQLQFKTNLQTQFPYISIACSNRRTVARVNTTNGQVIGEYLATPVNRLNSSPSRTTVDQYGNVWVANRGDNLLFENIWMGSITRIGLVIGTRYTKQTDGSFVSNTNGQYVKVSTATYNTCIDRDGDGYIHTSRALADILPWTNTRNGTNNIDTYGGVSTAEDEAITEYTRVYGYGVRTIAVDKFNDVWVGAWGDNISSPLYHQKLNGLTSDLITDSVFNPNCGGYGGVIDGQGALWSANGSIMWLRPSPNMPPTETTDWNLLTPDGGYVYGIALDPKFPYIWNTFGESGSGYNYVIRWHTNGTVVTNTGGVMEKFEHGSQTSKGLTVDTNGHVWVAQWGSGTIGTVGHLNTNGAWITNVALSFGGVNGSDPTGVSVDSNGKIWVTCETTYNAFRIDPNAGPLITVNNQTYHAGSVDMVVDLGDGTGHPVPYNVAATPYNYSDMTGLNNQVVNPGRLPLKGYWNIIDDSGVAGEVWQRISWNALTNGSTIEVYARSSDERLGLANLAFLPVMNNLTITNLRGRFIEVRLAMIRTDATSMPALYDLTLHGTSPAFAGGVTPVNNAVYETQTAIFTAEVAGPEPLTYQWFGQYPWTNGLTVIPGATNRSLLVTNVDSWDNGSQFLVRVRNVTDDSLLFGPGILSVLPLTNRIPATGTIGAASQYPATINVFGQPTSLFDVKVVVSNLCHSCPSNLNILLVSPAGNKIILMAHAGGGTPVTNATLIFEPGQNLLSDVDQIPSHATTSCAPSDYSGTYSLPGAPSRPYSTDIGELYYTNPNGTWRLYIYDDKSGDSGELRSSWRLELSSY